MNQYYQASSSQPQFIKGAPAIQSFNDLAKKVSGKIKTGTVSYLTPKYGTFSPDEKVLKWGFVTFWSLGLWTPTTVCGNHRRQRKPCLLL